MVNRNRRSDTDFKCSNYNLQAMRYAQCAMHTLTLYTLYAIFFNIYIYIYKVIIIICEIILIICHFFGIMYNLYVYMYTIILLYNYIFYYYS